MGYPLPQSLGEALLCGMVACASGGGISLDSIAKQVDYLDVYVRNVENASNAEFRLFRLDVAESSRD